MKVSEVPIVLDAIAGYDGRNWTPAARESWAGILAPYPLDDALRAVREHYATNENRVMPVHVRTRCIQLREVREASERRALPAPRAPELTAVGIKARAEVYALLRKTAGNMDRALREPPRADASEPTSVTSDITEAERERQLRRLRHEGPRG